LSLCLVDSSPINHAFSAVFRNLNICSDLLGLVFQVRCADFGDPDLA
jgi:hypothetical protein